MYYFLSLLLLYYIIIIYVYMSYICKVQLDGKIGLFYITCEWFMTNLTIYNNLVSCKVRAIIRFLSTKVCKYCENLSWLMQSPLIIVKEKSDSDTDYLEKDRQTSMIRIGAESSVLLSINFLNLSIWKFAKVIISVFPFFWGVQKTWKTISYIALDFYW